MPCSIARPRPLVAFQVVSHSLFRLLTSRLSKARILCVRHYLLPRIMHRDRHFQLLRRLIDSTARFDRHTYRFLFPDRNEATRSKPRHPVYQNGATDYQPQTRWSLLGVQAWIAGDQDDEIRIPAFNISMEYHTGSLYPHSIDFLSLYK